MVLLALDTCDSRGSVALLRDGNVQGQKIHEAAEDYSSWLIPSCQQVLQDAGLSMCEVDAYAVASGPGSFTGVRIGLTTVKAWSEVFAKPVLAVSRLEAIASHVSSMTSYIGSFFDARRNQLFGALYRRTPGGMQRIEDEVVIAPADYVEWVTRVAGMASVAWASLDLEAVRLVPAWSGRADRGDLAQQVSAPLAATIGQLGLTQFREGKVTDALHVDANYVRRSDAELLWKSPAKRITYA